MWDKIALAYFLSRLPSPPIAERIRENIYHERWLVVLTLEMNSPKTRIITFSSLRGRVRKF